MDMCLCVCVCVWVGELVNIHIYTDVLEKIANLLN